MQDVDEKPETIHLYVVREEAPKPSFAPIILSVIALLLLVAVSVALPYQQPVTRAVIRVPAVLLPLKTFTAQVVIIPTGVKVYPATTAHGVLTITNGSIVSETLPKGMIIGNVVLDYSVFVPPGSANGYGYTTVPAHSLIYGKNGNLLTYAIDYVSGANIYIRNLSPFRGGRDAYSVKFITSNDRNVAFSKARDILASNITGLHYPCFENQFRHMSNIVLTWRCQFVSYQLPSYMHVTGVKIIGENLLINVWFVPRQVRIGVK